MTKSIRERSSVNFPFSFLLECLFGATVLLGDSCLLARIAGSPHALRSSGWLGKTLPQPTKNGRPRRTTRTTTNDDDHTEKHRVLKLCPLKKILGDRGSASFREFIYTGITREAFKELLAKCWVGTPFKRKPSTEELFDYSETLNRLLVTFAISRID